MLPLGIPVKPGGAASGKEFLEPRKTRKGDDPGFAKNVGEQAFAKALISWMIFHESMLIGEVVPYLVRFLKTNPAAPEHVEFAHLLIDEFQDLNKAEQTALAYMGAKAMVCVVGDDDQSIYSFKSAHPDGIRQWKDQNPGCADLAMTDCHRCPTSVVSMANSLIAHNVHRPSANTIERRHPAHGGRAPALPTPTGNQLPVD